jgi:3-oxoacyl-[acyl-carrier-protein] synthase II
MKQPQEPRRVVVTGMGVVTSLGRDLETLWQSLLEGRSGVSEIRQFDSRAFPVRIGSEIDLASLPGNGGESRSLRFGLYALDRAWEEAGLAGAPLDRRRAGVCVGASTSPAEEEDLAIHLELASQDDPRRALAIFRRHPHLLTGVDIASVSTRLSGRQRLEGLSMTVQTACASATQAIGESFALIRSGRADLMVTGGTDSMMSVLSVAGFTLLGALSPRQGEPARASRPFDARRDGFVLGEGAGILILEELGHALARRAPILAEVIGYGSSSDAYRFTDVHPEGRGAIACMRAALANAGLRPEQVDYVNAHGTSTVQNDRVEALAIQEVFGRGARRPPASSSKSQLGHLVCAAGGVELVVTVLALRSGILPPTLNLEYPDPECDWDFVPNEPRRADVEVAMSSSFGFGGQNGTVVVRRWDPATAAG